MKKMTYKVKYYAGPYSGTRTVNAEDEDDAINKVRGMIRREMTLSMYTHGYKVISEDYTDEND